MGAENVFEHETDDQLVRDVAGDMGSARNQAAQMELQRRLVYGLSTSIKSLKHKVLWLDIVLAAATVVGALATLIIALRH